MHYHVKIDHKSRQSHGIHVKNLSREILKERVLIPYRQGSPITLEGTTVKPNDIGRVTIFETRDAIQEHPSLEALSLLSLSQKSLRMILRRVIVTVACVTAGLNALHTAHKSITPADTGKPKLPAPGRLAL